MCAICQIWCSARGRGRSAERYMSFEEMKIATYSYDNKSGTGVTKMAGARYFLS